MPALKHAHLLVLINAIITYSLLVLLSATSSTPGDSSKSDFSSKDRDSDVIKTARTDVPGAS
jgi:hypothetical protein